MAVLLAKNIAVYLYKSGSMFSSLFSEWDLSFNWWKYTLSEITIRAWFILNFLKLYLLTVLWFHGLFTETIFFTLRKTIVDWFQLLNLWMSSCLAFYLLVIWWWLCTCLYCSPCHSYTYTSEIKLTNPWMEEDNLIMLRFRQCCNP